MVQNLILPMPASFTFTVDNVGNDETITVQSQCREVTVFENANAATTDYTVRMPNSNSPAITKPAGSITTFKRGRGEAAFQPGQIIGYLATVTGSVTFAQEEH